MMIKHSRLRAPAVSRDWNHPTTFITRKVYDRYQYKLESLHDDWDLVLKIRRGGYRIVVLNEVLANFRYGGVSNERSLKKSFERGRGRYAHVFRTKDQCGGDSRCAEFQGGMAEFVQK